MIAGAAMAQEAEWYSNSANFWRPSSEERQEARRARRQERRQWSSTAMKEGGHRPGEPTYRHARASDFYRYPLEWRWGEGHVRKWQHPYSRWYYAHSWRWWGGGLQPMGCHPHGKVEAQSAEHRSEKNAWTAAVRNWRAKVRSAVGEQWAMIENVCGHVERRCYISGVGQTASSRVGETAANVANRAADAVRRATDRVTGRRPDDEPRTAAEVAQDQVISTFHWRCDIAGHPGLARVEKLDPKTLEKVDEKFDDE